MAPLNQSSKVIFGQKFDTKIPAEFIAQKLFRRNLKSLKKSILRNELGLKIRTCDHTGEDYVSVVEFEAFINSRRINSQ